MSSPQSIAEPFPIVINETSAAASPRPPNAEQAAALPQTRPAASSSISGRLRRVSQSFGESNLPEGFTAATGDIASSIFSGKIPSVADPGSPRQQRKLSTGIVPKSPTVREESTFVGDESNATTSKEGEAPSGVAPFANGYHFPPSHTFTQSLRTSSVAFWKYFTTPLGFCVTLYGLNVVAWGGMLFLLLCNASPAMCFPTCDHIDSPRRKWIEYDSQILNALFCVTGFGLAPWRFRDLYFLLQYRLSKKQLGLRRLAAIHSGWLRLPGSETIPVNIGPQNISQYPEAASNLNILPFPEMKMANAPLTGVRAPPSRLWKLDMVIWLMVWNTLFQICLAAFMWGLNRYDRPSWSTGLFVALGMLCAGVAGFVMYLEGKAVKSIEGVPLSQEDMDRLQRDREQGIYHYNNIKDKNLADKKSKSKH